MMCCTFPKEKKDSIGRLPVDRAHREVVISSFSDCRLFAEILNEIEGMTGIELPIVFSVASLGLSAMPRGKRLNLLVLDYFRHDLPNNEKKESRCGVQLHSDQGFQYTSQGYFKRAQSYDITPSMSRKGNPYDNAMAENFLSTLKTECIYRHKPMTLQDANDLIDRYIHFYSHERIQTKTGAASLTLCHSA